MKDRLDRTQDRQDNKILRKMRDNPLYGVYHPSTGRTFSVGGFVIGRNTVMRLHQKGQIRLTEGKLIGVGTCKFELAKDKE